MFIVVVVGLLVVGLLVGGAVAQFLCLRGCLGICLRVCFGFVVFGGACGFVRVCWVLLFSLWCLF